MTDASNVQKQAAYQMDSAATLYSTSPKDVSSASVPAVMVASALGARLSVSEQNSSAESRISNDHSAHQNQAFSSTKTSNGSSSNSGNEINNQCATSCADDDDEQHLTPTEYESELAFLTAQSCGFQEPQISQLYWSTVVN
eukprot:TRINITY_DN32702_c0_g1_i1.p1 TRINITY_DN32702_c0_g1~~TRINITY_DN32702_c0_g1_i1.p1  ORF type:complete len:141 (-),score=5.11 TRINITY_DN32702_c0_g1_i1:156-578(-)